LKLEIFDTESWVGSKLIYMILSGRV